MATNVFPLNNTSKYADSIEVRHKGAKVDIYVGSTVWPVLEKEFTDRFEIDARQLLVDVARIFAGHVTNLRQAIFFIFHWQHKSKKAPEMASFMSLILDNTISDEGEIIPLRLTRSRGGAGIIIQAARDLIDVIKSSSNGAAGWNPYAANKALEVAYNEKPRHLSFADWSIGGTFNSIGLDQGQFFVIDCMEHCDKLFPLVFAARAADMKGYKGVSKSIALGIIRNGEDISKKRQRETATQESLEELKRQYSFAKAFLYLKDEGKYASFIKHFGIEKNENNEQALKDRCDVLLCIALECATGRESGYFLNKSLSIKDREVIKLLQDAMSKKARKLIKNDTQLVELINDDIDNADVSRIGYELIKDQLLVSFMALTGWRASEQHMEDVDVFKNEDPLDQLSCPFRYQIKGTVPKTNGKTLVTREVGWGAFQFLWMQALCSSDARSKFASSGMGIWRAVEGAWLGYVEKLLNGKKTIPDRGHHAEAFQKEIERHKGIYRLHAEIRETRRLRDNRSEESRGYADFFIDAPDRPALREAMKRLSPDSLDHYRSEFEKHGKLSRASSKSIDDELSAGVPWVTPHSLRHMWAEAVYRRFDGDVGWMIRSQFKHQSFHMFRDYLRDKANIDIQNSAATATVDSLVRRFYEKTGSKMAGGFPEAINKIIRESKTMTVDEVSQEIADDLLAVSAHAWGFCILTGQGESGAACRENGVPQRQNACPALCMGCPNSLFMSSNTQRIALSIDDKVQILANEHVPFSYQMAAVEVVKKASSILESLGDERYAPKLRKLIAKHERIKRARYK